MGPLTSLPPYLLEGSNGAIAFALLVVVVLQVSYLIATGIKIANIRSAYYQLKPVLALTVAAGGLVIRSAPIWWQRFAWHHGLSTIPDFWFHVALNVVGTMMTVIGLLCWVRVTIPEYLGTRAWLLVVGLTTTAFGSPWLADGGSAGWGWLLEALPRFKVF